MLAWLRTLDRRQVNVIHLGVAFLILFSADFTINNMQKTITSSITRDNPNYNVDGYLTLCLLYGLYGLTLWCAPSFIAVIGYKFSLVIGASFLVFYLFSLTFEIVWVTYLGILLGGVAGSFIWAAEGHYIVINSDSTTMSRNTGIFWALYSASMVGGNIYAATEFAGKTHIDRDTRHRLLYMMGCLALVAVILLALLRKPPCPEKAHYETPVAAIKKMWQIFCTRDMLILTLTFIYGGGQQSFGNGVYSASIGFTKEFGTLAKLLVPISGLLYGLGDSIGGVTSLVIDKTNMKCSRRRIIIAGFIIQTIAYVSIYINLPNSAVFGDTDEKAYITPQAWLALICSFLIGFGDSCLNIQIFPLLRDLHPEHSAHTSALYKFTKSMTMALSFFLSSYMGLHLQMSIIFGLGVLGVAAFLYVDTKRKNEDNDIPIK